MPCPGGTNRWEAAFYIVPSSAVRGNEMGPIHADGIIVNKITETAGGSARHPDPQPYHNPASAHSPVPMNLMPSIETKETAAAALDGDELWYKDAIIYQLHVKAFADSNNDGIGDFAGLVEKLDYLQDLGVTALWLLPFYPSPLRDDGYDIADYTDVNAIYGNLADFKVLMREAHQRGLRVITELVINHTSDQHPWFQRARRSPPGSAWRDYYVWSDTPEKYKEARVIFNDFEGSNWTWDPVAKAHYWHRFYAHQPDLNFDNSAVHEAIFGVLEFWLAQGIDAMR